jgi:opacity protein-like surface antigen
MNILLVMSVSFCMTTGVVCAATNEFSSDGANFNSSLSFDQNENRISLESDGGSGWYIVPKLGMSMVDSVNYPAGSFAIDTPTNFSFDNGLFFGAGIGFEISKGFRFQFDATLQKNDLNLGTALLWVDTGGVVGITGDVQQTPLIFSLIWEGDHELKPHIGANIGSTNVEASLTLTDDGVFVGSIEDSEWALTYGLNLGFSVELSPSSDLSFDYRYLHVDYSDEPLDNHNVGVGFSFRF